MEKVSCPKCDGEKFCRGRMEKQMDMGTLPADMIIPEKIKRFRLSHGVNVDGDAAVCLECGMLWSVLSQQELQDLRDFLCRRAGS